MVLSSSQYISTRVCRDTLCERQRFLYLAWDLEIKGMAGVLGLYLALKVARNQVSTLMYVSSWVSRVLANVRW